MDLVQWITRTLDAVGVSDAEADERSGFSRGTVGGWMSGTVMARKGNIMRFARALEVDPEEGLIAAGYTVRPEARKRPTRKPPAGTLQHRGDAHTLIVEMEPDELAILRDVASSRPLDGDEVAAVRRMLLTLAPLTTEDVRTIRALCAAVRSAAH